MSHLPYLRFILVILLLVSAFSGFTTDELIQENTEQTQRSNSNTEIKKQVIDVNGRSLYFVEVYKDRNKGPKPLVIFVHGTPGGWHNQASFLYNEYLREHFHMISMDRLGHGNSVGEIEPSLQAQAASFKALLDRDTTGNGAIMVGHSLGGPIIARTAMDYPEQVSGLVFIASSGDPKRSLKWYNTVGGFLPVNWFLSKDLKGANREILPLKKQLKAMLPLWQNITVPTVIIQGGKDKLVNPKNADFLKQQLVNAKVELVIEEEDDHFLHWRRPRLVINALAGFINHK
jgi:Predicted hydrolases or acyltransferases (alpha/beta hydrolase superfamily)